MKEPRLIDAFSLSDEVFESKKDNPHSDGIIRRTHDHEHDRFLCMIALAPTVDAVPVVRCKDCVNCVAHRKRNGEVYFYRCDFHDIEVESDDFCSHGERKDGDGMADKDGVTSCKQVTKSLRHNGFDDSEESLATKKQATSNWISVEDRLPGHPNKVLIYSKSGKYGVGKYIDRIDCFIATGQTVVTHWMELPEPPEVST